ncbi:MAG: 23S rRNA (guanosine(2251)-2'-O)-methyltransferase RlmB [Hyphomicrobiales bacterium]|nr:RNA methyltransferase [Hyphomicrobiales bacterium]PCH51002.1 MAG: 23S rRNA (guanosine(2251)-2'-O)-methyltransferase RlmB [Hyphomicrobiales bacterium]
MQKQQLNQKRPRPQEDAADVPDGIIRLYGLHTVRHALENENRVTKKLYLTPNARERLEISDELFASLSDSQKIEESTPRELDKLVGSNAVHQGCVLEAIPLESKNLAQISDSPLLLVLDQVTDPHNVGAIMRSAVAMGAGAIITTTRHSPTETGVLAKSASGALDMIDHIEARNLSNALGELHKLGYQTIGLDSEGEDILENSIIRKSGNISKVALVMGNEGKGLRSKTRETCTTLARIDMPGAIKSLNVSNASALALYIVSSKLNAAE